MTKHDCISPQEIGDVMRLPEGAPKREHVKDCPRCSALLSAYREFMEDRSAPPEADLKDAERSLRVAFSGAAPGGRQELRPVARRRARWATASGWFRRGGWLLAPAALALAAGLYVGFDRLGNNVGEDRLRGPAAGIAGGTPDAVRLLGSSPGAGGTVELRWRAVEGATSYDVVIFGTDLKDLARLGVASDTVCVLRRSDLDQAAQPGALAGWQVTARRAGAIIARSPIASTRLP